ncbi:MAG: phage tail tube protein [Deltaproteobacteria bacterium]|jgi:hypothetical protein|nr:phage tail tube protein [Deltaproteobacteria bacterium]
MAGDIKRGGLRRLSIDGNTLDITSEGVTYSFGGLQFTEIMGADRYHGVAGKPVPAFIQFTITDSRKLDTVRDLLDKEGVTVTVNLLSGKILVLSDAINTTERTAESNEGKIALRFVGSKLTEMAG